MARPPLPLPQFRTGAIVGVAAHARELAGRRRGKAHSVGHRGAARRYDTTLHGAARVGAPRWSPANVLVGWASLVGLSGVATLVGPASFGGGARVDLIGAATVILGSFAWSVGSIYSRHAPRPAVSADDDRDSDAGRRRVRRSDRVMRGELAMFDVAGVVTHGRSPRGSTC